MRSRVADRRVVRLGLLTASALVVIASAGGCGIDRDELTTRSSGTGGEASTTTAVTTTTTTTTTAGPTTSSSTEPDPTGSTPSVPPATDGGPGSTTPHGVTEVDLAAALTGTAGLTEAEASCVAGRAFAELTGEEIDAILETELAGELDPDLVARFTDIVVGCAGEEGD